MAARVRAALRHDLGQDLRGLVLLARSEERLRLDFLDLGALGLEGVEAVEGELEVVVGLLGGEEARGSEVGLGRLGLLAGLVPGPRLVHAIERLSPASARAEVDLGRGPVFGGRPGEVPEAEARVAREAPQARVVGPRRQKLVELGPQLEVAAAQVEEVGLLFGRVGPIGGERETGVEGGIGLVLQPEPQGRLGLEKELVGVEGPAPLDLAQLYRSGQTLAHREQRLGEAAPGVGVGHDVVVPAVVPGLDFHRARVDHAGEEREARPAALAVVLAGEGDVPADESLVGRFGDPLVVHDQGEVTAPGDDPQRETVGGGGARRSRPTREFRPCHQRPRAAVEDHVEAEIASVRDEDGVEVAFVLVAEEEAAGRVGEARLDLELAPEDEVRVAVERSLGPGEEVGAVDLELEPSALRLLGFRVLGRIA